MNAKTARVLQGYINLSATERADLQKEIDKLKTNPVIIEKAFKESLERGEMKLLLDGGSGSCACCGR